MLGYFSLFIRTLYHLWLHEMKYYPSLVQPVLGLLDLSFLYIAISVSFLCPAMFFSSWILSTSIWPSCFYCIIVPLLCTRNLVKKVGQTYVRRLHLTITILWASEFKNRFNFRMARTRGFWSLFKVFVGMQDRIALDKLVNPWSEHKWDMFSFLLRL